MHHSASYHQANRHSAYQAQVPPPRPLGQAATYGGYGYAQRPPPPRGPPANADPQLWQWFSAVDTDRSGAISVTELQAALVNGEHDPL